MQKTCIISEERLREVISQAVIKALDEVSIVTEMAINRGDFVRQGISQSKVVLEHIAKICAFEDNMILGHYVRHWEDEIAAQIYDVGRIDIKKDNAFKDKKKKAFIESFIESRLGKNLCEYEEKMPSYFLDALESEGLSKEQIRLINIKSLVEMNKERIKNYLYSFVPLLSISDMYELRRNIKEQAYKF